MRDLRSKKDIQKRLSSSGTSLRNVPVMVMLNKALSNIRHRCRQIKKEHTTMEQWSIGKNKGRTKENHGFIYLFMKKKNKKSLPEGKKVASADVTDNKGKQVQEEEKQLFLFSPSGSILLEAIFKSR
ncbi:hypothetical protein CDAR_311771 [Caerostris darwini]|uniref:Uncharacterized protein n=1 Tax=Caerostris darwini TaxID=1538125 RepID=A0AAV4TR28_9ARAC|nr:hypothetical protein CDAR_311771 [Caerostris darwini]